MTRWMARSGGGGDEVGAAPAAGRPGEGAGDAVERGDVRRTVDEAPGNLVLFVQDQLVVLGSAVVIVALGSWLYQARDAWQAGARGARMQLSGHTCAVSPDDADGPGALTTRQTSYSRARSR